MANARNSEGWVYFIGTRPGEPVKIGHTVWPQKRLANIQSGNHKRLTILAALMSSNAGDIERRLHDKFADRRLYGEWFEWTRGIGRIVKSIKGRCPRTFAAMKCEGHTLIGERFYHPDLTQRISAVSRVSVGKTDTFKGKDLRI